MHKKAPSVVRPASLGGKVGRLRMRGAESGDVGDMRRAGLGMQGELARWAAAVGGGSPAVQK